jgi:addiction module HigA family antidote
MTAEHEIFFAPPDGFPLEPVHPGEMLREELAARGLTANALALKLRVPANRLTEILNGKRGISPDTALRLSRSLGPSAAFWLGLQSQYDLARTEKRYGAKIRAEVESAAYLDERRDLE